MQGVGFRPFICRLATEHGLTGEVGNRTNGVSILVRGDLKAVDRFSNEILEKAPPASRVKSIEIVPRPVGNYDTFFISGSMDTAGSVTEVSPDIAVCDECLEDLSSDRGRIGYPFINCTNCGPRFTITESLPYDRPNTSMKHFEMCPKCSAEYHDIEDRRFHAQPVACNSCGPELAYSDGREDLTGTETILPRISQEISSGRSVAIKGLGGYFLMCDALNDQAVSELRKRKQRDSKPFAVMFRDITEVRKYCFTTAREEDELISWRRPVVILRMKVPLAMAVNNGLGTAGAMLPYMPLHYLLFRSLETPVIVLTSGNLSDEPIITRDDEAIARLMPVAGSVVSYNREICNRTDDSVVKIIGKDIAVIRRSRGYVPGPVDLDFPVEGLLAMGAEQKSTFCIGKGSQAILSQHIGDLKNPAACDFYGESLERFSNLFSFSPGCLACDMHPDYFSTGYAERLSSELGVKLIRVQHHHAHIVSCMAEHGLDEKVIGISLDGTGYGTDGRIWGGEFMIADPVSFSRFAHFDYVPVPGGDAAVAEPWRMAYSYLVKYFGPDFDFDSIPSLKRIDKGKKEVVKVMILNGINSPLTSGAGRLFDAVSAILGLCTHSSFDSEAPMRLESAIDHAADESYPFTPGQTIGFEGTFSGILEDLRRGEDIAAISARFHNTIAEIILHIAMMIREMHTLNRVVLSGGVFQNGYLLERSFSRLESEGFKAFTNHLVPANDGGISLGQLIVAAKQNELCV